ncbi:hypothetical protein C2845_PM14G20330 [Panicum miliaceum]|uniref:Uncharacterized protein n=1 Tax=Panicum miliaceum TaxID=4540 RepID=A0A3L6PV54_PANMI|nr:hypothetical protein C2845_PM14G20330 [Panicum miliaceum]
MVHVLLDSISEQKTTGYVYSEISTFSEPEHVYVIISDADLMQLQIFLTNSNFMCGLNDDGHLQCGSIIMRKRTYPPTNESDERAVIVVEGPYSAEYDSVYVLVTEWKGLPPTL